MGKHDAAPTHGWVIMSGFHRRMSQVFIAIIIFLAAVVLIVYGRLKADCATPAQYHFSVFKYDLDITAATKPDECLTN